MKKLTLCTMAAFTMLSFFPSVSKADSVVKTTSTVEAKTVQSTDENTKLVMLDQIEVNEVSLNDLSEKKEALSESGSMKNDQGRRGRGYNRRHSDVNVVVSERPHRDYNRHGGTIYYTAGGGLLLILILILIL